MKKLMVAAAAAIIGFAANAAVVAWGSGDIFAGTAGDAIGTGDAAQTTGTGYLFVLGTGTGASVAQAATDWAALTTSADIWSRFDAGAGTLTINGHVYNATSTADVDGGYIEWSSTSASKDDLVYAAIVIDDTADNKQYAANAFSATASNSGIVGADAAAVNWVNNGTVGAATVWTASVPEPTSGLLLLIGMAGLALKRKRA